MNEQEQIKRLSGMIENCIFVGDSNNQIAEMAITMALHWNQDTEEVAPNHDAALSMVSKKITFTPNVLRGDYMITLTQDEVNQIKKSLTKARGEK